MLPFLYRNKFFFSSFIFIYLYLFFIVTPVKAIDEYSLFKEGYDLYLSCEPAKASEKFRIFLKEFPDSSAKDAALFWLGKALMQMDRLKESVSAFIELRKNYPNSPFNSPAGKEIEKIRSLSNIPMPKSLYDSKLKDPDELNKLLAERDKLKALIDENKKKVETYEKRISDLEAKERRLELALNDKKALEESIKKLEIERQISVDELRKTIQERDSLIAEMEDMRYKISNLEKIVKELEAKDVILKEREKEIEGLKAEVNLITQKFSDSKSREIKLSREMETIKNQASEYKKLLEEAEKKLNILIGERERLKREVSELEGKNRLMEREVLRKMEDVKKVNADREEMIRELTETMKKVEMMNEANKELEGKIKTLEKDLERITDERKKIIEDREAIRSGYEEKIKEIELLKNKIAEISKREDELIKSKESAVKETVDLKKRIKEIENSIPKLDMNKLTEERDRLKSLLSEEKRKYNEANSQVMALKERERELLSINATMKGVMEGRLSEVGKRMQVCENSLSELQKEKLEKEMMLEELKNIIGSLNSEVSRLQGFESDAKKLQSTLNQNRRYEERIKELEGEVEKNSKERLELVSELKKKDDEALKLKAEKKDLEKIIIDLKEKTINKYIVIGNERFSYDSVSSYMLKSQLFLSRIGVRSVPWRKGDPVEDFISEYILYEEAKRLNSKEKGYYDEFNKRFNLTKEENEYLDRFKMISNLINHELKKLPSERLGEAVILRYKDEKRFKNASIVADMQIQIKSGIPIKDILNRYPDAEYKTLSEKDVKELFGDLSNHFSDNEVVSTFDQERFMTIRIKMRPVEYRPFDVPDEFERRLKGYISKLLSVLRSKAEIRISD